MTKDELLNAVWNDCSVSDNSLTRSVATLRRLLQDDVHEPRYIATVHTLGYRFMSPVILREDGVPQQGPVGSAAPPRMGSDTVAELKVTNERSASGNERSWAQVRRAGFGLALVAILFGGFLFVRGIRQQTLETVAAVPTRMQFVPLISLPGWARGPALSPDGERVAFFWNNETPATWNLYVQLVGGEKPFQLTHSRGGFLCCADWSPDGREIAFGRCDDDGGGVFVVPALGGTERKLTEVNCAFGDPGYSHWTPDGKSLLLADQCTSGTPRGIVLFSLSTGERRCLHAPHPGDVGDVDPLLSPDGRTVAFLRSQSSEMSEIYTAALSGGAIKELTHGGQGIYGLMWAADGKRIVFHKSGNVMHIAVGGGAIEPEIQYPASGSLSHDGRRMAYEEAPGFSQGSPTVWRAELSSPGGPVVSQTRILASPGGNGGTQLSLDGRQITFQS